MNKLASSLFAVVVVSDGFSYKKVRTDITRPTKKGKSARQTLSLSPPLIGGDIKRCFCLTSVCLSVAYVGLKSRTERPRKTKIGTEVAHVTRDSDTTFKVKRSKVKVTRPLWLVVLTGQHGHTVMVTYPYAYMTYIVSPLAGLGGGISWRPPAYSLLVLLLLLLLSFYASRVSQLQVNESQT